MNEVKRKLVQDWLDRARRDLVAARVLMAGSDSVLANAIYDCQQAAEKAVKGFLIYHDRRFRKTHNIQLLVTLAEPFEARFSTWLQVGSRLTPYVSRFRYPPEEADQPSEPSREEVAQALQDAEGPYAFVLALLPAEVHP